MSPQNPSKDTARLLEKAQVNCWKQNLMEEILNKDFTEIEVRVLSLELEGNSNHG